MRGWAPCYRICAAPRRLSDDGISGIIPGSARRRFRRHTPCPGGETGRRRGLKIPRRKACRFESDPGHHRKIKELQHFLIPLGTAEYLKFRAIFSRFFPALPFDLRGVLCDTLGSAAGRLVTLPYPAGSQINCRELLSDSQRRVDSLAEWRGG
ncbi:hypothetical protein CNECB9_4760005 [Cupriavidus necator]|uniref:Uncharacterized protein n=1 Tax=Cupriavidus necator TaxID=106590 RepID=A0A1K0ILW3_CUPNE|nr:hypothetical protein CNECB9_4760005 [Cupriavidus necator]